MIIPVVLAALWIICVFHADRSIEAYFLGGLMMSLVYELLLL